MSEENQCDLSTKNKSLNISAKTWEMSFYSNELVQCFKVGTQCNISCNIVTKKSCSVHNNTEVDTWCHFEAVHDDHCVQCCMQCCM